MPVIDGEYVESDDDLPPPATAPSAPSAPSAPPVSSATVTAATTTPSASTTAEPAATTATTKSSNTDTTVPKTTANAQSSSTKSSTSYSSNPNKQKRLKPTASSPRLEHLYSSHRIKQELMKKKRDEAVDPECTFAPKLITSRRSNKKRESDPTTTRRSSKGNSSRFDRLYQSHRITQDKIARKRQQSHNEECTFTPKTNSSRQRNTNKTANKNSLKKPVSRHDLLYDQAKNRQLRKEQARMSLGMEECTFSPKINSKQLKKERTALYDYEKIMHSKSEREFLKVERAVEGCTFSPDINRRSPVSTSPDNDVSDRLYRNAKERKARLEKMEKDQKEREDSLCSFKPAVNKTKRQGDNNTFERLYANAQEQRYAREIREQTIEFSFRPEINEKSRELARHSDDRSLHEYLYKEGLAKTLQRQSLGDYKTSLRHRLEDEEMEFCTFHPKRTQDFVEIQKAISRSNSPANVAKDDNEDDNTVNDEDDKIVAKDIKAAVEEEEEVVDETTDNNDVVMEDGDGVEDLMGSEAVMTRPAVSADTVDDEFDDDETF